MRSFDKLDFYRLARALLTFLLAPARAVGEQFWQALIPPKNKKDGGWLPAAVRLIARLTAVVAVIVVPTGILLMSFPGLARSHLLERIFTQFFAFLLPAWLVGVAGLVCALLVFVAAALAASIGARQSEFAPGDGVDALRHLLWRAIPSGVAIAVSALAISTLSTLARAVAGIFEAALRTPRAGTLRMKRPVVVCARSIAHVCLCPRLLAQRPFAARALRAGTNLI